MPVSTSFPSATPSQVRGYISDMLSELADLARTINDNRLECSIRILALDVLATRPKADLDKPDHDPERRH